MDRELLYDWCKVPVEELKEHKTKIPFRIVRDSKEMGQLIAKELLAEIDAANQNKEEINLIIPCGPDCWYRPFTDLVNSKRVSLKHVNVFHMDECLDWEGKLLPENNPYNFRTKMEKYFYEPVDRTLMVPFESRHFLNPDNYIEMSKKIEKIKIDLTIGGWGQDGHVAYNQANRHSYLQPTLAQLKESGARIQENNLDTVIALAHRTFGAAYQFVPPRSVTLGMRECMSAKKIRLYSDTGAWKQTAFRVALFSEEESDYPITLLQNHPDALLTATQETADHPISHHPEWEFKGVNV